MAGRADWSAFGPEKVSLRIVDFELDHLQANAFNNLVLLLISDKAVLKRLMAARDLYWTLPSGRYHDTTPRSRDWEMRWSGYVSVTNGSRVAPVAALIEEAASGTSNGHDLQGRQACRHAG